LKENDLPQKPFQLIQEWFLLYNKEKRKRLFLPRQANEESRGGSFLSHRSEFTFDPEGQGCLRLDK